MYYKFEHEPSTTVLFPDYKPLPTLSFFNGQFNFLYHLIIKARGIKIKVAPKLSYAAKSFRNFASIF